MNYYSLIVATLVCFATTLPTQAETPLIRQCEHCHINGGAAQPATTPLTAMSKDDIIQKLKAYRHEVIPDSVMMRSSHDLTDEQINRAAEYYQQLSTQQSKK